MTLAWPRPFSVCGLIPLLAYQALGKPFQPTSLIAAFALALLPKWASTTFVVGSIFCWDARHWLLPTYLISNSHQAYADGMETGSKQHIYQEMRALLTEKQWRQYLAMEVIFPS